MRIVVVGGAGNFGARIVRALRGDPNVELLVAGRRNVPVPAAEDVPGVLVDIDEAGLVQGLKAFQAGIRPFALPCLRVQTNALTGVRTWAGTGARHS